jgi:triosephosphate isomerase
MAAPLIVVNCKTYGSASGDALDRLLASIEDLDTDGVRLVFVVSAFDLHASRSMHPQFEFWSQHLDPVGQGSHTGWLEPETAMQRGARGTLVNHAEHKVDIAHVEDLLSMLAGRIDVCACAADEAEARRLAALAPTMIAVEPPELIGGDISVTTADPGIVRGTVDLVKSIDNGIMVLCGAGVKNGDDVAAALRLGAEGVLLASGVTKATDPAEVLTDLIDGARRG